MRIAIGESLILEVRTGTPVHAIVEFARARGHNLSHELWCGDIRLDQAHPAGQWPLVGYPKITSQESHSCAPARGTQLVVVTGPDAGKIVHTKTGLIGRSSGDNALQDPWLSRTHARLRTQPDIAIRDHGSRNGTSVLRDGKRTQIW